MVLDKVLLSIRIKTFKSVFTLIIKQNSTILISKFITITTIKDFVTKELINIYQGESDVAIKNVLLSSFTLKGISYTEKGLLNICITFSVNAKSII